MIIGILTFWGVPNYGCFFQAYALQKAIQKLFPLCEVRQISHLAKQHYDYYYSMDITGYKYPIINPHWYKKLISELFILPKKKRLLQFQKYYDCIPNVGLDSRKGQPRKFDCIVLGSDVIWDFANQYSICDPKLFGIGLNGERIISYAPSCGNAGQKKYVKIELIQGIKDLDSISVRDKSSRDLLTKYIDFDIPVLLDPTFLYNFNEDEQIIPPRINQRYVIVYGNNISSKTIDGILSYSKKHKIKIVNIVFNGREYKWCDENVARDKLSPFEWLGLFKHSEFVITSTYHGLLFGLIFQKKISFTPSDFIINKAGDLIKNLNLSEVLLSDFNLEKVLKWKWDYKCINDILYKMKQESLDYLKSAIF